MRQETRKEFVKILHRIYSVDNREKYRLINIKTNNSDEERVWQLCGEFWHPDYSHREHNIDDYEINPNLDEIMARKYIKELNELLDKLGWS